MGVTAIVAHKGIPLSLLGRSLWEDLGKGILYLSSPSREFKDDQEFVSSGD